MNLGENTVISNSKAANKVTSLGLTRKGFLVSSRSKVGKKHYF